MSDSVLNHLQPLLGIAVIIAIGWALVRRSPRLPRPPGGQRPGACRRPSRILLLKLPLARQALLGLNAMVTALTDATRAGAGFVFGYVGGGPAPFAVTNPAALTSFAFGVLPLVIVISALSALLWYWRILPLVVGALAFVLRKTLGLGGAVGLGAGATIFLGMIEAPLLIRPCLPRMTRTELFILMTVGLASVAGTVFVLYATILHQCGARRAGAYPGRLDDGAARRRC